MLGEPGDKGDPLTHPRLTLLGHAEFLERTDHSEMRESWLRDHPKARLYVDFADFGFVRFQVTKGYLNGGFGAAFVLSPADLFP